MTTLPTQLPTQLLTDTWVAATRKDYIRTLEDPAYEKTKGDYFNGKMRLERSPLGMITLVTIPF